MKNFLSVVSAAVVFFIYSAAAHAQFMQNYDELHDGYAISSSVHPSRNITLYVQKIFPSDGSGAFYAFAAYDNSWQDLFTTNSSVSFIVDGSSYAAQPRVFSREMHDWHHKHTASRVEFIMTQDLIDALVNADEVTVISGDGRVNYEFKDREVKEIQRVIARSHY